MSDTYVPPRNPKLLQAGLPEILRAFREPAENVANAIAALHPDNWEMDEDGFPIELESFMEYLHYIHEDLWELHYLTQAVEKLHPLHRRCYETTRMQPQTEVSS